MNLASIANWVIEGTGPKSVACFIPDPDGSLCDAIIKAGTKRQRFFRYIGLNVSRETIVKCAKEHPAVLVTSFDEPRQVNCDLAICPVELGILVWHNPMQIMVGGGGIPDGTCLQAQPNEPKVWFSPAYRLPPRGFEVRTKNCVADEEIQKNVTYNLQLGLPEIPRCKAHGLKAIMVSGGISVKDKVGGGPHFDEIREDQKNGGIVVCVKTSHDWLLNEGIVPWACMLLDPRDHVKDFIENPHPDVNYFCSSTCHQTTLDRLISRGSKIWLYHALVGAGEQQMLKLRNEVSLGYERKLRAELGKYGLPYKPPPAYSNQDMLISGGTASCTRGMTVLHTIGFRWFSLYGYDCCYWERPDMTKMKEDGQPRYHKLKIGGRKFATDAELYAQAQDFDHMLSQMIDCHFEPKGDGMIPWKVRNTPVPSDTFERVFAEYPR